MSEGKLSPEQMAGISRGGIKRLIKKYNASNNQDKESLTMIFDYLSKTPLFFAVRRSEDKSAPMQFVTLMTGGQVFIPIFTEAEDFGKLADSADAVCLAPLDYFNMLLANDRHAVINPFGDYFLLWPELIRDHLLPFTQDSKNLKEAGL